MEIWRKWYGEFWKRNVCRTDGTCESNKPIYASQQDPCGRLIGGPGEVRAEITEDSLNAMQTVHGGLMFVMAEIAAGLVTRNDGRKYVTLDSSFRFLRGSSAKNIQGLAQITKRGKTVCFTKAEVVETDTGKLLAEGEFTFYCMGE